MPTSSFGATPNTGRMNPAFPTWPEGGPDRLESTLLERWAAERLFAQVQTHRQGGAPFVFFEGPPTANGRPGIHHVFSRTIKDLFCRFRSMQGRSVTRIAGWDTHGLPVEIEVEKSLKLSGKKDIEAFGVEAFNRLCRESVFTYQADWRALSDRIGYWLDYDRPYVTCTKEYIESVWWLLKRLFEKGLLVRGHRVLPYCPRCGTALSSHELSLGYEDIHDRSIYVAFPLEDGRELVVWTTTPWTLPSNVAVAVHPDLDYGTYRQSDGRRLVLATARAGVLSRGKDDPAPEAERVEKGAALVGLSYRRPLEVVPLPDDRRHSIVVAGDFVAADEGSGAVHMAPAFGADDYAIGQEQRLAMVRPVAPDGTFNGTTWPELEGRLVTAEETNELIVRKLKDDGRHLKTEQHNHSYPHCWRCKSKLIYYAKDSWFVRTSAVKDRLLAINQAIDWHPPEVGTGRFGGWLANNVDWALSRDRYWGTPLPVWVSDRDPAVVEVIGSLAELEAKVGRPLGDEFDPHKPFIDEITWPGSDGATMRRVPEVIDTWFDSGSMPYAQWHYPFEGQAEFKAHFPADFICEGVDQTRGWFYSLLAIATTVFDELPYRNVVVNELVLDAQGQKMSKSKGNVVDPWEAVREFGADQVRFYLVDSSQVWVPKPFVRSAIPETAGGFFNTLRNTYSFLALYASGRPAPSGGEETLLDRWIRGRLAATVRAVTAAWEEYDATTGIRALKSFVEELSNWYVRQSRARFWAPDREADPVAVRTLFDSLVAVARMLAPVVPFASDWLHRALTGDSVHLADFPVADGGWDDPALDRAMDGVRRLASLGRSAREAGSRRVRQPLATMRVAVAKGVDNPRFRELLPLLAQEVNVKRIEVVSSDADLVRLKAKANFRSLGKRFGKRTPVVAERIATLSPDQLRQLEGGTAVTMVEPEGTIEVLPEDVVVEREVAIDWLVQSEGPFVVALDPTLTPDLVRDGLAREIVSRVQRLRKDAGYEYTTRIALAIGGDPVVLDAAHQAASLIQGETLARELRVGQDLGWTEARDEARIDEHQVTLAVARWTE
jgi:isoleucyl-tRNA synthetase